MDRLHRISAKIAGGAFLGLFALGVLFALSLSSCQSTTRADTAIDRSEFASKGLGFTLPNSAHEIYYLFHTSGRSDTVLYLRFDLDPAQIDAAIHDLLAANDSGYNRKKGYERMPLASASVMTPRPALQPVPWWRPAEVTHGYYVGEQVSQNVRIIVDQDQSRIYFFQNG